MKLSRNFSLSELIKSDTAIRLGIDNNPNADQIEKLKLLCENILQPVRDHFGRVTSQHTKAEAADFECLGTSNAEVFDWIKANLDWDQMILEFYTPGEPNSGWVHCSWVAENPRKQLLRAFREDGKVKYKPIIGNAVDLA
jgi:zinc D-Ala-D-Ala carboxypeptidase